ncbi:hypothetical protein H6P81_005049 [Aristolochia fimbriata]|uniref:Uncharacterized protein n=1 Tax=Aristolochia fimbriata TaxID=158543 RepID=A0AAV7ETC5_ARIFI|nr:hypothetical protein H6P81_005049 [Aristolochia fimbriata]
MEEKKTEEKCASTRPELEEMKRSIYSVEYRRNTSQISPPQKQRPSCTRRRYQKRKRKKKEEKKKLQRPPLFSFLESDMNTHLNHRGGVIAAVSDVGSLDDERNHSNQTLLSKKRSRPQQSPEVVPEQLLICINDLITIAHLVLRRLPTEKAGDGRSLPFLGHPFRDGFELLQIELHDGVCEHPGILLRVPLRHIDHIRLQNDAPDFAVPGPELVDARHRLVVPQPVLPADDAEAGDVSAGDDVDLPEAADGDPVPGRLERAALDEVLVHLGPVESPDDGPDDVERGIDTLRQEGAALPSPPRPRPRLRLRLRLPRVAVPVVVADAPLQFLELGLRDPARDRVLEVRLRFRRLPFFLHHHRAAAASRNSERQREKQSRERKQRKRRRGAILILIFHEKGKKQREGIY